MPHGRYIGPKLLIIVTKEQDEKIRALAKERHQKINAVVRELLERGIAAAGVEGAVRTLLRTHVRLDPEGGPMIDMGAVPESWQHGFYAEAWLLLWDKYGLKKQNGENHGT